MRKVKRDAGKAAKSELGLFRRILEELNGLGAPRLGDMRAICPRRSTVSTERRTGWWRRPGARMNCLRSLPYLRLFGLTAAGAYLAKAASVAHRETGAPPDFVPACRFYAEHLLIGAPALAQTVMRGANAVFE